MPDSDDGKPPDLRFTKHERNNIEVDRNLSEDGHLARGDNTRMSRMNFTARARPAEVGERDPVFVEREFGLGAEGPPPAAPEPVVPAAPEPPPSLMQRISRLFGRQES